MDNALATLELAPDRDVAVSTQTTKTAVAAMELLRHFVRSIPFIAANDHRPPLLGLVAWYERVCVDESYTGHPPVAGMNALFDTECQRSAATAKRLVAAKWAIRVAEEIVNLRSTMKGHADEGALAMAQARLDGALQTALERLGTTAG